MNRPHNIVVVVLDSVRDDIFSEATTPTIDSLIETGSRYTHAVAPAPWSAPSHAGIFSGDYTDQHRVYRDNYEFRPENEPLASRLSDAGYETIAVSNNPYVSTEFCFDRGFDEFLDNDGLWYQLDIDIDDIDQTGVQRYVAALCRGFQTGSPIESLESLVRRKFGQQDDSGGVVSIQKLLRRLTEPQPVFAFTNLMETHSRFWPPEPYRYRHLPTGVSATDAAEVSQSHWEYMAGDVEATPEELETLRGLYRAAVEYADNCLETLVSSLQSDGQYGDTLVVITADHGENLGENGMYSHTCDVSENLLHVPLVVSGPGVEEEGETHEDTVSLRNLYDALVGVATEGNWEMDTDSPVFSEYAGFHNTGKIESRYGTRLGALTQARQVVYEEGYKFVRNEETENKLYRLEMCGDGSTLHVVDDDERKRRAESLLDETLPPLDYYRTRAAEEAELTEDKRDELESLGYL